VRKSILAAVIVIGLSLTGCIVPTEDAVIPPGPFTVTFSANGGSGPVPPAQTVPAGSSIILPSGDELTRNGFVFGGWNPNYNPSPVGDNYSAGSSYTPTYSITLFARWLTGYPVVFKVTDDVEGTPPPYQLVPAGSSIILPDGDGLTRSGYVFKGWYVISNGTTTFYSPGDSYRPTIAFPNINTLMANWAVDYDFYITFDVNGGSGTAPNPQGVVAGSTVRFYPPGLTKDGYVFDGWNTSPDGTGTTYNVPGNHLFTEAITLYAKWVLPFYTVTFSANGGSGTPPDFQNVTVGSGIILPDGGDLARSGYVFGGWNTNYNGTETNYNAGESYTPTGNITLFAKWNSTGTSRIVYYWVDQHGSLVTTGNGSAGTGPGEPLAITAQGDGYTVRQWYVNGINTGESGDTYIFSSTISGKYTVDLLVEKDGRFYNSKITITVATYTVTFDLNGGSGTTPAAQTVSAGSVITLPGGLTRSGHNFLGWSTNSSGTGVTYEGGSSYMPTGTITLFAKWSTGNGTEANPYVLTSGWRYEDITSTISGTAVWFSFNVTSGTTYYVWWNDKKDGSKNLFGNPSMTVDVRVSASYSNGSSIFFDEDYAYVNPKSFTANTNGMVKIKVTPYSSGSTGRFGIAYRTTSTRP